MNDFVKTLVVRIAGIHTAQNHVNGHGEGTIQSIIEAYALRVVVAVTATLYGTNPKFKEALDAVVQAIGQ